MTINSEVVFDSSSGISIEEQKEILSKINGITEKNRRQLSSPAVEKTVVKPKKNSALFPLLVNILAVLILCAGAWGIFSINEKKDIQVRRGAAVFDLTERALIDEIRSEFSADSAMDELARMSNEQDRAAAIEAQLAGGLAAAGELIKTAKYDQAAQTVENLRYINNTGVFSVTRSFQARREFYNTAIDAMKAVIEVLRISGGADSLDLHNQNSQLEEKITEMQKTIDAFSTGSSGQARRLIELEESVSKLEKTSVEKDKTITSLETEKSGLTQTVSELRTVTSEQDQEILNLRSQIAIIRQLLQE